MPYTALTLDVADRIATLTVNRPDKLNALNDATIRELGEAAAELRDRDDVGGIFITGAGTKAFVRTTTPSGKACASSMFHLVTLVWLGPTKDLSTWVSFAMLLT
jgi:hypothetical protein